MLSRRILGSWLLLALVAPALHAVRPGVFGLSSPASLPGCCAVMPCCASGSPCAPGSCEKPGRAAETSPASTDGPRLAAGCAPAGTATVPAADGDPMIAASGPASPTPRRRAAAVPCRSWPAPSGADDPRDPPPRA